ncbi:MAG: efflux RND transporter permease subunit [Candidatus Hydrogenedentes bacterium]|nr:efflux RND transporter permease subunit [Candidatus Hydrogenedentota bacterium]
MRRFLSLVIRNTVLVNVLLVLILILGGVSSSLMVKELFPKISVDTLVVEVAYPGADPEEVEEGVSRKIEEAIDGIEGIKRYMTISAENGATAMIEVVASFSVEDVYTDVRSAIDAISTFPVDAEKPIITEISINEELINLAVWSDQPERVMKEFAEDLKDEIQALPSVSQVEIFGTRDYEIAIEISEGRLREFGLSFQDVATAVRRGSLNLSGGLLRTKGEEIRLRTLGRKYEGGGFAEIVVLARPGGDIITLGDIANIKDAFAEDQVLSVFNGQPCLLLTISKTQSEDAFSIVEEVREYIEAKQATLPEGLNLTLWADRSEFIRVRINLLVRNGIIGLAIVFLSLWLFLEIRLSFWVTLGIPVSLSGGLVIMWLVGASINTMSLFGLIMVLGIVVDDAIIIGEAIYVHRRNGDSPMLAAVNGVIEVGMPVLAAVTTSIIAFIPLMFVDGVLGKFVKILPVAIIASLTMSLIESLFLLPSHLNHLPDMSHSPEVKRFSPKRLRQLINAVIDYVILRLYRPFAKKAIEFRYVAVCTACVLLMATWGLVGGGFVKFVIFPETDANDLIASIEFPDGTPLHVTDDAVHRTREAFERLRKGYELREGAPVVKNIYMVTGLIGAEAFDRSTRSSANNVGHVRIELVDGLDRLTTVQDMMLDWENEVGLIPGAVKQTFATLEMGPPGAPIEIALKGDDIETLLAVSKELKAHLQTYDGIYQIGDTYRPGKNEMRIKLKPEARTLGLTLDDLARQVYAGFYGEEALRLQRGRDDIRVKVRYTEEERNNLAELEQVRIRTPQGFEVPFYSVAQVSFERGDSDIVREDGRRIISVTAENDPRRVNADEVLANVRETILPDLERAYPGFSWSFQGMQRASREAFAGLFPRLGVALIGIFVIIASIFRSYVQPLVIMVAVPFGFVGAVLGHYIMGIDLQMFSVFGMVALTGVVVNDAIVLIEAFNTQIAHGSAVFDAIVQAGVRRFRAIMLTSISTVGGLMPLILEKDAQAQIVIPMALSLAGGVLFATVITLVLLPCLLGILSDGRRVVHLLYRGRWPSREEIEPARTRLIDPLDEDVRELAAAK